MDHPVLRKVIRFDSTPLNAAYFTEEGYLIDTPILTSTGIFEYANPDGSLRRELRLPEDVFDRESLKSYRGKPVIITHDAGLVDKTNVHDASIGTILSDGYRDGNDVRANIVIHETDEMKKSGFKELSLGYNLDLDETPGVWHGEHYDAIQKNIRINHLALVREARAGDQARLNVDSKDGVTLKGGKLMPKTFRKGRVRGDEALSPEELEKAIAWYKQNRDTINGGEAEATDKPNSMEDVIGNIRENHPVKKDEEPYVLPEKKEVVEEPEQEEFEKDADEVIKDQDKDIKTLLDIIDTLLAERAFDEAEEDIQKKEEVIQDIENEDDADEEIPDMTEEDLNEDDADEDIPDAKEGEEEFAMDEDEDLEEEPLNAEELVEDGDDCEEEELPFGKEEDTKLNMDSIDRIVRERVKIGMIGKQLNMDGLENMSIRTAKKAIIKAVRPKVRLDGKSAAYINAMYDCAVQDVKKNARKDTNYQRKQMFNKDSASVRRVSGSEEARERMIKRHKEGK